MRPTTDLKRLLYYLYDHPNQSISLEACIERGMGRTFDKKQLKKLRTRVWRLRDMVESNGHVLIAEHEDENTYNSPTIGLRVVDFVDYSKPNRKALWKETNLRCEQRERYSASEESMFRHVIELPESKRDRLDGAIQPALHAVRGVNKHEAKQLKFLLEEE